MTGFARIDPASPDDFTAAVSPTLQVQLTTQTYPIHFLENAGERIRAELSALAANQRRSVVLTDTGVAAAMEPWLHTVFGGVPRVVLEAGESTKSLASYGRVLDFLAANRIDRTGVVWAVGGGVVGDLAGFVAASWLRGIDLYQVPTTLLAMVDSSVGGKTGINLAAGKNLVGAFHQPKTVFIGTDFLQTLPAREFAAGMAEVIKYGLLGDPDLFVELERAPLTVNSAKLAEVILRCCAQKARVVAADERELAKEGGRALLNLGHTFGHAIEQVAGYGAYLHGEAVAIGLCAAARLSQKLGYIDAAQIARVERVVAAHALPTSLRTPLALAELLTAMARDKKVRAGLPRFVVLKKLGEAMTQENVPLALAETCFREVGAI